MRHELCHGTDVTVVLVISLEDIGVLVEEPFVVVPGFLQQDVYKRQINDILLKS